MSEYEIDNLDLCPWSTAFDKSEGHIIMSCVFSRAEYVNVLIQKLAKKYELSFYEPQDTTFVL